MFPPKWTSYLVTQLRHLRASLSLNLPYCISYSHQFASWISLESTTSLLLHCYNPDPTSTISWLNYCEDSQCLISLLAPLQPILHTESHESCLLPKHRSDHVTLPFNCFNYSRLSTTPWINTKTCLRSSGPSVAWLEFASSTPAFSCPLFSHLPPSSQLTLPQGASWPLHTGQPPPLCSPGTARLPFTALS